MLVAISDIHLDDGTSGKSLSTDAFEIFRERLEQLAFSASWRTDGSYRPLERIDLLLLGDIFELIHSTRWLKNISGEPGYVRPWSDPNSAGLVGKVQEITQAILEHNSASMVILRKIADGVGVTLPPVNAAGQPALDTCERLSVPVHIFYMVGNHDWFFHLPGEAYRDTRQQIIEAMGLQNTLAPIPYQAQEWDPLLELFERYRIFARHGDCYDKWCYNPKLGRNVATLADALAVELVTRFPAEVEKQLGDRLPGNFYHGLREMINVRPNVAVPLWVASQIKHYGLAERMGAALKEIWNDLVTEFLKLDFVHALDQKWNPFDNVDELELLLKLTRRTSLHNFNKAMMLVKSKLFDGDTSFAKHAMKEDAFISRKADFIVYGHTHHHETIPLDVYSRQGKVIYQFLVNTGTWRSYYDLTRYHPEQQKFMPLQLMSYMAFFIGDERTGRRHEAWLGKLV
jgi:UDP-2,3-diacylglucosamine pyrophosphatase LpxH